MKVYLFSDYLKTIHGEPLNESQVVCEIGDLSEFPRGLISINGEIARSCSMGDGFLTVEIIGDIPRKEDVHGSDNITCPWCGHVDTDSWEAVDNDDSCHCDTCGTVFSYERLVEVTYSSTVIEKNNHVERLY